jgi:hypothetical protein
MQLIVAKICRVYDSSVGIVIIFGASAGAVTYMDSNSQSYLITALKLSLIFAICINNEKGKLPCRVNAIYITYD